MNEAFSDLKVVKEVLDKYKVEFLLAYGTCLGAHRDGDFLPGDDDIDLVVTKPIDLETRKAIGWMLYDLGFQPQNIAFKVYDRMEPSEIGYNGDSETGIICCQKSIKFTIFFFKKVDCPKHGKEMLCIAKLGAEPLISSPAKFYEKPEEIEFKGEKFLVPSPVEDYLSYSYEDWKDPYKRDHSPLYPERHKESEQKYNIEGTQRLLKGD